MVVYCLRHSDQPKLFRSHFASHTSTSSTPEIDRRRSISKSMDNREATLENSYLHQFLMKLDDSKLTMMLQEMEKVLVPLGTPGSKHSRSY